MVEELTSFTSQDLKDLDALMHELSATSYCNEELLNNVMKDANSHVYVIRKDGHIVATGTLCILHTLEFTIADIESVVVNAHYRRQGFSKVLMTMLISIATDLGVNQIHLTSNSNREKANKLYQMMGFELYNTNCYRICLPS